MTAIDIPVVKAGGPDGLPEPVAAHAAGRFADAGVLLLKSLYDADRIAALHDAYSDRLGGLDRRAAGPHIREVGDKRLMIALDVTGAFADPDIFANPVALSIAGALLGDDFILGSYVAVTSMPGAKAQTLHADQEGLFGEAALDTAVPAYSITLAIPLVGLNPETGGTRFFPGSHRDPDGPGTTEGNAPDLDPGDAVLFDSRIGHGGMANRSKAQRPILYCTYHRAWYRDVSNFRDMPPMLIDRAALDGVPEQYRWLMSWAVREGG